MNLQVGMPESTYRLQFHAGFTFGDATAIVDYLADLGVTHAYASPYLAARPGSTHGYDVIDHSRLNPEVGTGADLDAWIVAMKRRGMSHILDTVPNHMGVGTNDNAWWNDVLEHGRASRYSSHFDVAWRDSPRSELRDKVMLPVLGSQYGEVLEKGELRLAHEGGKFVLRYYEHRFPIDPTTCPRSDGKDIAAILRRYNGTPGDPRNFDALHELIAQQHYRLAYWRIASDEINYRRFFDINDLAALRMERQEVFDDVHRFTFQLLREGRVAGLRIDHPDGLYDPKEYFDRLQRRYAREAGLPEARAAEDRPLYVLAEKILAIDEPLPETWACHGTSGYDFLVMANGLFVDGCSVDALTRIYADWIANTIDFDDLVYEKKKLILKISLAGELNMLAHQLDRIAQGNRRTRDFTLMGLHDALRELIACFPVYRSYVTSAGVHESDARNLELAVERAIKRNPTTDSNVFRYVSDVVLLRSPLGADPAAVHFAGKFQQLTAPTTAKGIEDTAFYIYNRLISLNEVGGEPNHFGTTPQAMHAYLAERQRLWPHALSATSTHDTKRSEDVRARINVLSEIPDQWHEHVTRWGEANAPHRRDLAGQPAPSRNDEYLLYQTLIGVWPLNATDADDALVARAQAYMTKACREAKLITSWTSPNEAYENAVRAFVAQILSHRPFLDDFVPFQARVAGLGLINSLAQTLLRLTAPGVPDTYQGQELWDFSLVDPDNRRPVDYARRRELLDALRGDADARELLAHITDGRVKLFVTWRTLTLRREHPGLFTTGTYEPLPASGAKAAHAFAFARRQEDRSAIVVVPRLPATLVGSGGGDGGDRGVDQGGAGWGGDWNWADTTLALPRGRWRSVFTGATIDAAGEPLPLATLLADFPVALLIAT
ncbi:MAG TPA: malto-oligosyltrehalose synthase [Tepidisphaeraceae bacterium]|nr:malto-oligosyltrehalose synthase [Tepidisphaeraceae bacterium]